MEGEALLKNIGEDKFKLAGARQKHKRGRNAWHASESGITKHSRSVEASTREIFFLTTCIALNDTHSTGNYHLTIATCQAAKWRTSKVSVLMRQPFQTAKWQTSRASILVRQR